jgi:GNAT superfamily N-acetyltransferase
MNVTNLFLPEPEVRALVDRGEMERVDFAGGRALLRRVQDFRRLYFTADSAEQLTGLRLPEGEVIADVVGRESDIAPVASALAAAGFRPYKQFQRMSRAGTRGGEAAGSAAGVRPATSKEAPVVHRLIWTHFDPRAEHLPPPEEVAAAVEAGTVLVAESEHSLAALLFHSGAALTSTLRYWLVLPEYRGMGHGQRLMDRYFAECPQCRRFLLWVQRDNSRAIRQYERAGYRPDGLIDHILRRSN